MSMIDLRQADMIDNIRYNPYWIHSPQIDWDGKDGFSEVMDDNEAVLFSFPAFKFPAKRIRVHEVAWEIITQFTRSGGTGITMSLGTATISVDEISDGGTVSNQSAAALVSDLDEEGSAAMKTPEVGKTVMITPADADVPVVYVDTTSDGTITAGALKIWMLISEF